MKDKCTEHLSTLLGVSEQLLGSYHDFFLTVLPYVRKWFLLLRARDLITDDKEYQEIFRTLEHPSIRWEQYLDIPIARNAGASQLNGTMTLNGHSVLASSMSIRTLVDPPEVLSDYYWPVGEKGM